MVIVILIISFLLDGILSNYLPSNMSPLFSLIGLIVSYEFFSYDNREFYKYAFILGFCYDMFYTDTFVFYGFLFLLISMAIAGISRFLASSYLNLIIVSIICIILFRTITYFSLLITGNIIYNIDNLLESISSSLIINIIYGLIVKFICNRILKFKKKRKKYY